MTPLRQRICGALFGLCLVLCAGVAFADEAPDASVKPAPSWLAPRTEKPKAVAGGASVGLGRSVGVLLLTAVLGGCALYLRSKKTRAVGGKVVQQLRVVSAAKIGPKAQLVLAEVDGRKILLGVTDSAVNKLGWIESDEEEEASQISVRPKTVLVGDLSRPSRTVVTEAAPAASPAPKRTFRDLLASAVGNIGHKDDDSAAVSIASETRDTFTRSTPRRTEPVQKAAPTRKAGPQMLDVEGQAKGLLARLGDPRA